MTLNVILNLPAYPAELQTDAAIGWLDGRNGTPFSEVMETRNLAYLDGWVVGFNSGFASLIDPLPLADRLIIRSGGLDRTAGGEHGHWRRGAVSAHRAVWGDFLRPAE